MAAAALKILTEAVGGGAVGGAATKGAKDVGGKTEGLLKNLLDVFKGVFDIMTAIFAYAVMGVIVVLKSIKDYIVDSISWYSGIWDSLVNLPAEIWNAISEGYTNITNKLGEVWEAITNVATRMWEFIKQIPQMIWDFVVQLPAKIWEFMQTGFDLLSQGLDWVGGKIKEFLSWLWEKLKPIVEPLLEKIKGVWDFLKTLAADIWEKLKTGFEWIRDKVQGVWDSLTNLAQDIADKIKGVAGGIGGGLKNLFGGGGGNEEKDFVMRPGQGAVSFSPQDTLIGVKDAGSLGGGTTINFYGLTMDEAIQKVSNELGANGFRYGRL